ncbi:hypothetical protein CYY_005964 [Polysphondylium violaceum]|uniref:ABC transporter domain-containing protein n=1 Tax=Polysphondylium violaceum TaxID=133409 RepID=A0A8J4PR73_9MYCE|nr:hypothetical protein CYY_005964 [Polysphondylium violaceum]
MNNSPERASALQQFSALMYKQFLLFRKNKVVTLFRLLTPIVVMSIYAITYSSINNSSNNKFYSDQSYPTNFADQIKCCDHVVGYSYNNDPSIPDIMPLLAKTLDMDISNFVPVPQFYMTNQTGLASDSAFNRTIPNFFATVFINRVNSTQLGYNLYYNYTTPSNPMLIAQSLASYNNPVVESYAGAIQIAVEKALINTLAQNPDLQLTVRKRAAPSALNSNNFNKTISLMLLQPFAALFIYFSLTFPTIMFLNMRAEESQRKIRAYLKTFGVYDEIYLASWLLDGMIGGFYSCVVLLIFGYACPGFDFFTKTTPSILFVVFMTYSFAMNCLCLLLGSLLSTTKGAVIISVVIFTLGLFTSIATCFIGNLIYNVYGNKYAPIGAIISILPFLNINKILTDIATGATPSFLNNPNINSDSSSSGEPAPNILYDWGNFTSTPIYDEPLVKGASPISGFASLNILFALALLFLFLAWYLDKVLAGPFGGSKRFDFLFTSDYWTPRHIPFSSVDQHTLRGNINSNDPDIAQESQNVTLENMSKYALIIRNLDKEFDGKYAVNNLSLAAENGKIIALLGHNGAGKTTTINILTNQTNPTSGTALIYGYDCVNQASSIHTLIGYTPQFDVNWPNFTAREHLKIMSSIKEKRVNLEQDINNILKQIRLTSVADNIVGSYSGGMQRRLSCGLALIGNPKIIILDEPTTGVDPANRLYLWRLIKSMKKDRLVLLTTHSMEEADALSDKIAIMSEGRLAAVGTPTHLKSRFSSGFKLHIISSQPDQAVNVVRHYLPTAIFDKSTSNTLVFTIQDIGNLSNFLKYLAQDATAQSFISDWQIQGTTIEDVFLKVAHDQKKHN